MQKTGPVLALTAAFLLVGGCETMTKAQSCPPGSAALSGSGEDKSDGTAIAKIDTPDGGIRLDAVNEGVVPLKATAEVRAQITRSMKTSCLNDAIVKAVAANPEKWLFKLKSDGTFELSAK